MFKPIKDINRTNSWTIWTRTRWLLVNSEKVWCMKNVNEGRRFLILFLVKKLKGYFSQLLQTAKNQSQCFGAFTDCKTFNFHVFSALYSAQNILIDFLSFLILEKAESTFLSFFILKKLTLSFFFSFSRLRKFNLRLFELF